MEETRRFNFQEYEIDRAFDGKPHSFTKAFWNGEEREFALALVNGYVRFCEVDKLESGEWNFAANIARHFSPNRVHMPMAENIFLTALEKNEIGRLFFFSIDEMDSDYHRSGECLNARHEVFVDLKNNGFIKCASEPVSFEIPSQLSITGNSFSEWYSELERQLEDTESNFHFSYQWHQLRDIEKGLKLVRVVNGTRAEMERIADLILSLDDNLIQEDAYKRPLHAVFKLGTETKPTILQAFYLCFWNDVDTPDLYEPSPLWGIFLRYFQPRIDTGICEKYSAPSLTEEYLLTFARGNRELTAHERIEMRVELIDWLRGKVPDEEIDSLLRV